MGPKKYLYILMAVVIIIVVGLVIYYQQAGKISLPESITNLAGPAGTDTGGKDGNSDLNEGKVELRISADGFKPDKFHVKKLIPVDITLINEEKDMPNSLRFEDGALSTYMIMAPSNGTQKITLVPPDKAGKYVFFTDIGNRREGVMIVE
jgi:hypothetical protein